MANEDVRPADCYTRARMIAAELELIRQETGRPTDPRPALTIRDAAPREAYFAAIALFHKADQLCFEQTGDDLDVLPPAPPAPQIHPIHVLGVLNAADREIQQVKTRLGITAGVAAPAMEPGREPSHVFTAIVQANRQLNLLLERPFSPADVYQQIQLATRYAELISARAGNLAAPLPPYEGKKRPADVYRVLLGVMNRVQKIATKSGHTTLSITGAPSDDTVVPGDVYDLATTVLAELVFLHAQVPGAQSPQPFDVRPQHRRLPSHCFQAARGLEAQLAQL